MEDVRAATAVRAAARGMLTAQLSVFGSLIVCSIILPGFLFSHNMGGVSNFAVHASTIAPYSVGVLVAAWLQWRGAGQLAEFRGARRLVVAARLASCGLVVNLLTTYPYKTGEAWATLHSYTAIALAVIEFGGGLVVAAVHLDRHARVVAVGLLVLGFAALFLTYIGRLHVLFLAEVTTAAGFGVALVAATRTVGCAVTDGGNSMRSAASS